MSLNFFKINSFLILSLLFSPIAIFCNPKGGRIVHGEGKIQNLDPQSLEFKAFSDRTIVKWENFSIQEKESARFILPKTTSMILNRVESGVSHLLGKLQSNGRFFLINPNGVLIGKDGVIQASHFMASTLDVLDQDFLNNKDLHFFGNSTNSIVNLGKIEALEGDAFLLGYSVENQGKITASQGTVGLASGATILLKPEGKQKIFIEPKKDSEKSSRVGVINSGEIKALCAEIASDGNLYALAIQDSSTIDAIGIRNEKGKIYLVAPEGKEKISGNYTAEGGEITFLAKEIELQKMLASTSSMSGGGDIYVGYNQENQTFFSETVFFDPESHLYADAQSFGNGGKIVLAAQKKLSVLGDLSVQGGIDGGNGGSVEVSTRKELIYNPVRCLREAPKGNFGTLVYDPVDVIVDHFSLNSNPAISSHYPPSGVYAGAALLNVSDLVGLNGLAGGNVVIDTGIAPEASLQGNVYINQPVIWNQNTTLSIKANHDITIQAPIKNLGNTTQAFLILETETNRKGSILIRAPLSTNANPSLEGQSSLMCIADQNIEVSAPITLLGSPVFKEDPNLYFETRKGSIYIDSSIETFGQKHLKEDLVINSAKNIEIGGKNQSKIVCQKWGNIILQAEENIFIRGGSSLKDENKSGVLSGNLCQLTALSGDIEMKGGSGEGVSFAKIEGNEVFLETNHGNIKCFGGRGKDSSAGIESFGKLELHAGSYVNLVGGEKGSSRSFQGEAYLLGQGAKEGSIKIQADQVEIKGGQSLETSAWIQNRHELGKTEIFSEKDIILFGGSSEIEGNCFAKIEQSQGGELNLKAKGKICLFGGESFGQSDALITMNGLSGNLKIEANEIILKADGGKAKILHSAKQGDLELHSLKDGIKIFGGRSSMAFAKITHQIEKEGELKIVSDYGSIFLEPGIGQEAVAAIEKIGGSNPHSIAYGLEIFSKEAPLCLSGSSLNGSDAGCYILHAEAMGSTKISAKEIEIDSGKAFSKILMRKTTGDLEIDLGQASGKGDLFIKALEDEASIEMNQSSGQMKIQNIKTFSLQGGFGKNATAAISIKEGTGDIVFQNIEKDMILSGGTGSNSQAYIENRGSGSIFLGSLENPLQGNLILKAGSARSGDSSASIKTFHEGNIHGYILGDYLLQGGGG